MNNVSRKFKIVDNSYYAEKSNYVVPIIKRKKRREISVEKKFVFA